MNIQIDKKIKALIFDIDGTLADTMPIHYKAWQHVGEIHGFDYPEELFYELAGIPTTKIVPLINEKLGYNLDVATTIKEKEKEFFKILPTVKPIKPIVELVHEFHGKLPMSLGTGGRKEIAKMTIDAIGLGEYFDILVAAEDVDNHKPAPDTFLRCAELMNVEPEFCQVFEDGEQGIKAAKSAGMIVTDVRPLV